MVTYHEAVKANHQVIQMWAHLTRCRMCKHKEAEGHLLPVKAVKSGKLQPNVSVKWAFHYSDTHGMPRDYLPKGIALSVYGIEPTMQNLYGATLTNE